MKGFILQLSLNSFFWESSIEKISETKNAPRIGCSRMEEKAV